jgi:hypothetical protein
VLFDVIGLNIPNFLLVVEKIMNVHMCATGCDPAHAP